MAFDKTRPLGSDLVSDIDTIIQANNAVVCKRSVFWYVSYPVVGTNVGIQFTMPTAGTMVKAWAKIVTAPVGASILIDINLDGTSIWASTQANRLSIVSAATSGTQTAFDTTTFTAGQVLTLDIDQIGSTTPGAGLTVQFDFELA